MQPCRKPNQVVETLLNEALGAVETEKQCSLMNCARLRQISDIRSYRNIVYALSCLVHECY